MEEWNIKGRFSFNNTLIIFSLAFMPLQTTNLIKVREKVSN
jgi:uncharacterized membrane protein